MSTLLRPSWTLWKASDIRRLATGEPVAAAQSNVMSLIEGQERMGAMVLPQDAHAIMIENEAIARWIRGPRRYIRLTDASKNILNWIEPRFRDLPINYQAPWMNGLMLELANDVLCYIEPWEDSGDTGVRTCFWYIDRAPPGPDWSIVMNRTVSWKKSELPPGMEFYTDMHCELDTASLLIRMDDNSRFPYRSYLHLAINALAAYHADPQVVVGRRSRKMRKHKEKGHIQGVKRHTLTEDGTKLITRRWITVDYAPNVTAEKMTRTHKGTSIHNVDPHQCKTWVRAPKTYEAILGTKQSVTKKGKVTLYCVSRNRGKPGGYARGGDLTTKKSTMVTGLDDG